MCSMLGAGWVCVSAIAERCRARNAAPPDKDYIHNKIHFASFRSVFGGGQWVERQSEVARTRKLNELN